MSLLKGFQCPVILLRVREKACTVGHQLLIIWSLTTFLISFLPFSLHSSHSGLLAIPQLCQACTCLRVFTHAVLSAWNAPLSTPLHHLLQVSARVPPPGLVFPSLTILYKINPSCCQFLAPFLHSISTTSHLIVTLCYYLFPLPTMQIHENIHLYPKPIRQ